jgi:hypothetical protein
MTNDMSNDMVTYAEGALLKMVNTMMPKLKSRFTRDGESYQLLRTRYAMLNNQRNIMALAVSKYIGGVYVDRSFGGQATSAKPFTPVPVEYQKKAIALLNKNIFAVHEHLTWMLRCFPTCNNYAGVLIFMVNLKM